MTISEMFHLDKSQAELDFIDIDPSRDTPLFIDPHFLSKKQNRWSIDATLTLRSFFQAIIDFLRADNTRDAKLLFDYLHEPNSTCLGLSRGNPDGNGVGDNDTDRIFERLVKSRAIQTGLIQDIEDNMLFVDYFGKDKLSDMTTNIINKHLIDYTIAQCNLHGIPLMNGVSSGHYWSKEHNDWYTEHTQRLVVNNKPILLVPKGIVSFVKSYTPEYYYNHFVLHFLQDEHIRINSALVQFRQNGTKYVTKKDLKESNPLNKEFLRKFTLKHPEVLQNFKDRLNIQPIQNQEISNLSFRAIADGLIGKLNNIPSGGQTASEFHSLILGIIELLFYPDLINPVKEREIHDGRKRIDITFDNASTRGIFYRLSENMNIPCPYVFIECKNYTSDVANPEIDQLAGRFSGNRGRFGILICRTIQDKALFLKRCKDTYADNRGLIIPLEDSDIKTLLQHADENNREYIEGFISNLIREVVIN